MEVPEAWLNYKTLFAVVRLGIIRLKKTGFMCFLDLLGRRGGKTVVEWCDLMGVECFMVVVLMS